MLLLALVEQEDFKTYAIVMGKQDFEIATLREVSLRSSTLPRNEVNA
ncbi:MAG: hypothetical protein HC903_25015 [Methylacidiphilales bacterium]|nr:hypothetical protein [Candidatus Methylacidiphilales bacterium]NJR16956.1 hypothetical protein [Calothrix sp. CSU_2_0]